MLRIDKSTNGATHLAVSGDMNAENLFVLAGLIGSEPAGRRIILDLKDLIHVDQAALELLARCEVDAIELENCSGYVREWIRSERSGK